MSETMIRVVGSAIAEELLKQRNDDGLTFDCYKMARVAIEAMRRPNANMEDAADENGCSLGWRSDWEILIGAALGEIS